MKIIKFDGTVGIISCKKKGMNDGYLALKKGIGSGIPGGKIINHGDINYEKGGKIDLNKCDVVLQFKYEKSIDILIKHLKITKRNMKENKDLLNG